MGLHKIKKILKNPVLLIAHLCRHWPFRCISDEKYLKISYRAAHGKKLNLLNPTTYNEKLQWLKLYDRRPEYTVMTDKYLVRRLVSEKIGSEHLIPLLGVWDTVDDININELPDQFVLKANHDSGSVVICKNKKNFNWEVEKRRLKKALSKQYFWKSREYNYFNIQRKIIAEKYMVDDIDQELRDYKFYCFDGIPMFFQVDVGRFAQHVENFYTMDKKFIPVKWAVPADQSKSVGELPQLNDMKKLAQILSQDIPHVRVDFYIVNGWIYFGELTFHSGGGFDPITPDKYDRMWGELLKLPKAYLGNHS